MTNLVSVLEHLTYRDFPLEQLEVQIGYQYSFIGDLFRSLLSDLSCSDEIYRGFGEATETSKITRTRCLWNLIFDCMVDAKSKLTRIYSEFDNEIEKKLSRGGVFTFDAKQFETGFSYLREYNVSDRLIGTASSIIINNFSNTLLRDKEYKLKCSGRIVKSGLVLSDSIQDSSKFCQTLYFTISNCDDIICRHIRDDIYLTEILKINTVIDMMRKINPLTDVKKLTGDYITCFNFETPIKEYDKLQREWDLQIPERRSSRTGCMLFIDVNFFGYSRPMDYITDVYGRKNSDVKITIEGIEHKLYFGDGSGCICLNIQFNYK
jgi:hypothetical protein